MSELMNTYLSDVPVEKAVEISQLLESIIKSNPKTVRLARLDGVSGGSSILDIPTSALSLLNEALIIRQTHPAVRLVSLQNKKNDRLSTQAAADLLKVSRPYIVKCIDEGLIDCIKIGRYRNIEVKSFVAFAASNFKIDLQYLLENSNSL